MKLRIKRQDALALFYRDGEAGEWFAVCCAGGLMAALGRKVEKNEEITVEMTLKEEKS